MLVDAEKIRKDEELKCQEFTNCKSTKGKGSQRGLYVYTDCQTDEMVPCHIFEKR
jgi:hypothetical protein